MKAKGLIFIGVLFFIICFTGCNDDDKLNPIELKDITETNITILFNTETPVHTYTLQGGDGNYKIKSENSEIVTAELISPINFRLEAKSIGEATVTITDNSQNILKLSIYIKYESHRFVIKAHDVFIVGDNLTENEKMAIKEKQLAEILVKIGGGYEFVYTDPANKKGNACIYTDPVSAVRIETTFEDKCIENQDNPGTTVRGYEVQINDKKRLLVIDRYFPSSRSDAMVSLALFEDVTSKVQVEFPNAESVFTAQVVELK